MVGNAAGAGTDGVLSAAGEGRAYQALGSVIRVKASGQETGNAMEVFESDFPPGMHLPPHRHRTYDEAFYVLSGAVQAMVGARTTRLGAGSFGFAPRGVAHTFGNDGPEPARVLIWQSPAYGFEQLAKELSQLPPGEPDMSRLGPIFQKYDLEPVGPPPGQ